MWDNKLTILRWPAILTTPTLNQNQKTLLLAGAGDLSQRTAALLHLQGYSIWGLRRQPPKSTNDSIQWLSADLSQPDTLAKLPKQFTHVLYATSPDARNPDGYLAAYRQGLENLINHLDLTVLQRLVFVSSTAVYGPSDQLIDETTPADPQEFNGKILLDTENYLYTNLPKQGVVLQPSGLYGPGRNVLLRRLKEQQLSIPYSIDKLGNKAWANRFHIDDAASACAHLLTLSQPLPCYIGTDDHPMPTSDLYVQLASLLGVPQPTIDSAASNRPGKRLSNARLKASGFKLQWPDAITGYKALIASELN